MVDISSLRSLVRGPVLTPADDGFADEVTGWTLNFTNTPDVAVGAATPADVVAAVEFATANGLAVRAQGTGHGAHEAVTDGVLILTRRLSAVTIDPTAKTATFGAGVQWTAVVEAAAEFSLAPVTGSSPTVGAVGFLLGGGMGPLVRSYGFASDRVVEFEIVTGGGELLHANTQQNPDLFWALRGGKGGLGVVTEATVELLELSAIYGGSLTYDAEHIETALRAWIDYTTTADPDVSTSVAILRVPDLPFIPAPIRGRTLLSLRFAYPGDSATGERLAAPFRAAAPVYIDALGDLPVAQIGTIHNDPPNPSVGWVTGRMLSTLDQDFATILLGFAGADKRFPFVATELRHLGPKSQRDVPGGSAVGGRPAHFTLNVVAVPDLDVINTVAPAAADAFIDALSRWVQPENNVNFSPDFHSRREYESAWPAATFSRLTEIKRRYDPAGTFAYGVR